MVASLSRTARKCDQPAMNLIDSLDDHVDAETETLWLQEAERRYLEYRESHTQGRSADDAFANLLRIRIQVHPVDAFFLDKERHSHDMPDCKYKTSVYSFEDVMLYSAITNTYSDFKSAHAIWKKIALV